MACCILPVLTMDSCSPYEQEYSTLPALSIKQPFASLVTYGMKQLEIRSRRTQIRGRVIICASQKPFVDGMFHPETGRYMHSALEYVNEIGELVSYGRAVGMVDIVGCRPMQQSDEQNALIRYRPDMWAWELDNPVEIEPFEVCGQLGFFRIPAEKVRIKSMLA